MIDQIKAELEKVEQARKDCPATRKFFGKEPCDRCGAHMQDGCFEQRSAVYAAIGEIAKIVAAVPIKDAEAQSLDAIIDQMSDHERGVMMSKDHPRPENLGGISLQSFVDDWKVYDYFRHAHQPLHGMWINALGLRVRTRLAERYNEAHKDCEDFDCKLNRPNECPMVPF